MNYKLLATISALFLATLSSYGPFFIIPAIILIAIMISSEERKFALKELDLKEQVSAAEAARDKALASDQKKSQFLASMSHEIRTPLNSIIGYSDLLTDEELSLEQRNMLETVKQSSETLLELINDILDFSKIEAQEMTLEQTPFDLEDLIYQVNEQARPKIIDQKVQLHVRMDDIKNKLVGDPTRLKQILSNLISNAVKFTEFGEVTTRVKILCEQEHNITLQISVEDTGIGIHHSQLKNIFQAFKQAENNTTRKFGGTGLGLSISSNLIALMDSEIKVQSKLARGTTFSFNLTLPTAEKIDQTQDASVCKNRRIVVIDSNETSINTIKQHCYKLALHLETFLTLEEAMNYLQDNRRVDVLINNFGKSKAVNIKEQLQNIYLDEKIPHTIAITESISHATFHGIKENDYDSYLLKPIRFKDFAESICQFYLKKPMKTLPPVSIDFCKPAKILLVEDNKTNQLLAFKTLTKMGHGVTIVNNGKEAVDTLAKNKFEIVFMDVQMPIMNGIEAVEKIRLAKNKTPIIALTASAFEADKAECKKAGMDGFIAKPLHKKELSSLIKKHTSKESSKHSSRRLLLVEDDETTARIYLAFLKEHFPNFVVKVAENGIEACSLIGSFQPETIILDIDLPDMDGVGVLRYIKNHKKYHKINVIINSALPESDSRLIEAQTFDVVGNMRKSPNKDHIVNVLKTVYSQSPIPLMWSA